MFRSTPRCPPTLTSDSASRQPRGQLGRNHRKIETRVETREESATSAEYKILLLKESATQWLQRRYQVELEETAVEASKLGDHHFYPKRKSLSSPLSKWCVFCGLHKDMHKWPNHGPNNKSPLFKMATIFVPSNPLPSTPVKTTKEQADGLSPVSIFADLGSAEFVGDDKANNSTQKNNERAARFEMGKTKASRRSELWNNIHDETKGDWDAMHAALQQQLTGKVELDWAVPIVTPKAITLQYGAEHTSKIGGRADAPDPAAAFDDCLICAETFPLGDFCQVSCCRQKLCQTCVEKIIETKAQQASEILSFYLSRGDDSHQCPQCGCGPIEHFACSDLTESSHNRCPSCSFASENISAWPKWDGELCESLQAYEHGGKIDCPFCRKKCSLFLLGNNGSSRTRGKCGLQNANSVEMSMVPGFGNGRFSIRGWTTSEN